MKAPRHLFLFCATGDPQAPERWRAWLPAQAPRPSQVWTSNPEAKGARGLAQALGVPLQALPSLAPLPAENTPAYLNALARWGQVIADWMAEDQPAVAWVVAPQVVEGVFRVCFGLPLASDLTLHLSPGSLLHLAYDGQRDTWMLLALRPGPAGPG